MFLTMLICSYENYPMTYLYVKDRYVAIALVTCIAIAIAASYSYTSRAAAIPVCSLCIWILAIAIECLN